MERGSSIVSRMAACFALFSRHDTLDVELKQIEMAFEATPKNLIAGLFAVALISLGLWTIPSPDYNVQLRPFILLWAVLTVSVLCRGIYLSRTFHRMGTPPMRIQHGRKLARNGTLAGLAWGSSSFLLLQPANIEQSTFLTCSIGLVIMGGAGAQAQYKRLVIRFVPITTAMFICGILANQALPKLLALGFILYAAVALEFARQQQASVGEVIKLNMQNELLLAQAKKNLDDLEAARAQAESANGAKTRFLAAASHDLRQPMHALAQYVDHLRRVRDKGDLENTLDKIGSATSAMKDLLDAVLDLSRINLGVIRPEIVATNLGKILDRIRMQLLPQAEAAGLDLQVDHFAGCVVSDPVLLERIIRNIALNAIRYTERGKVSVQVIKRGGYTIVRIADTGIGIPKPHRQKIFEEFYQIHNSARERRKGLGLGLAIVSQLGALLSHPVKFHSKVGKGTIFRVILEACSDEAESDSDHAITTNDYLRVSTVLVIDDDPLIPDSMKCTLRDFGCHVMTAGSAMEALAVVGGESRVPDLIVSDYHLRHLENGIDAIRILRENLHGIDIPVVFIPGLIISGDTSPEEQLIVSNNGLEIVYKPLSPSVLRAKLNEMLERYHEMLRRHTS